ncbi:MAG: hypothetical protein R3276_10850 [Marinobacter sp.]|nr:hypothetical protein [Marinobacter sp.]
MLKHAFWLLMIAGSACALPSQAESTKQSFESCSMITSEYLTILQLMSRGFERDALINNLPGISDDARQRVDSLFTTVESDGLVETYSRINSEYARCAKGVYDSRGTPADDTREAHFHFCAGENKVRYEILLAAVIGADQTEVAEQLAAQHQPAVPALYELYQSEGALQVFDELASELKRCLNIPV